jgi:hydroxyacylglutathione hydrolase
MSAEGNKPAIPQTTVEEVIPGIVVTRCPLPTSYTKVVAMILAKGERLAVIDTGVSEFMPGAIEPALTSLGSKLSEVNLIVNTHGHWDHTGGNALIHQESGAPVWIPTADANMLESVPERLLRDGDEIDLGSRLVFEVVSTPGHTPGSVSLYNRAHRLLIAADAVQGPGAGAHALLPVYFYSGRRYRASLQRLLGLSIDTIVLGHPLNWTGPARCVHRGEDAYRFIAESLDAATKIEGAVHAAMSTCPNYQLDCIRQAVLRHLESDPLFREFDQERDLSPGADGTLQSELRDLGIELE